ncbi:helix-turn-helix domain-containing protein [Lactobacillaceae bacterium Melli_B3]
MATLGPIVKQIRIAKGFTQDEVYYGIISRSFINRFERGENDIQASKLLIILDNLGITLDEFKYISNHYQISRFEYELNQINQFYDHQDFAMINSYINKHQHDKDNQFQLAVGYADILLKLHFYDRFKITASIRKLLSLINTPQKWTLQEIKLAKLVLVYTMEIKANQPLGINTEMVIKKMEFNCQNYTNYTYDGFNIAKRELISFYGVLLQGYLNQRDYKRAKQLIHKFINLRDESLDLNARFELNFWIQILELYFGDYDQAVIKINEIIKVLKIVEYQSIKSFETIFKLKRNSALQYRSHPK